MSDLVLLDFDGVVNALADKPDRSAHTHWERTELLDMPILYSPDVVVAINRLARQPHVTVWWLTSWEADSRLFTQLGFDDFDYVPCPPDFTGDMRSGDWKLGQGLAESAAFAGTVIWIDDSSRIEHEVAKQRPPNITTIRPARHIGLSRRQLRTLEEHLN